MESTTYRLCQQKIGSKILQISKGNVEIVQKYLWNGGVMQVLVNRPELPAGRLQWKKMLASERSRALTEIHFDIEPISQTNR